MTEIKRWHCPGQEQSKDKPLLIFPAAGWYDLQSKKGFAGPGWLVAHPGDPVTGPGRKVGYYLRNQAGQLVLAWVQDYNTLTIEASRREVMVHTSRGAVQVVQYIDNAAGLFNGYTVQEWADPRPEPYLAQEAVVKAITDWEAVERPW